MSPHALLARWQPYILEASRRFNLPASWIRAVMQAESGGRTTIRGRPIVSRAGALGLMQLLPETYNDMRVRYRLGTEIADPHDNIIAGAAYLRALHRRYGFPLMFAAYNAGPRQFERDVQTGQDLPAETRAYIRNVVRVVARTRMEDIPSAGTVALATLLDPSA
jgi:soluble lytic murein transglycosylase-like protein